MNLRNEIKLRRSEKMKSVLLLKLFCVSLVFSALNITSCDMGNSSGDSGNNGIGTDIGQLQSVKTKGIKSVYTSNIGIKNGSQSSVRAALSSADIQTLSYINDDGKNTPVIITTSTGKEVVLQMTDAFQVGTKRLVVKYSAAWEIAEIETDEEGIEYELVTKHFQSGQTLINMETGKLYEFSSYPMSSNIVDGNILYTVKDGTLYKIDLENISSAVPLNNSTYNSVDGISMLLGDKIIASISMKDYAFDVNSASTPKAVKSFDAGSLTPIPFNVGGDRFYLNSPEDGMYYMGSYGLNHGNNIKKDNSGNVWFYMFAFNQFHIINTPDPAKYYIMGQISIDNFGQLSISNYSNNTLSFDPASGVTTAYQMDNIATLEAEDAIYILRYNGYIKISKTLTSSGFDISSYGRTMPNEYWALTDKHPKIWLYKNYLYWMYGTDIKRMLLSQNSSEEIIFSDVDIVDTDNGATSLLLSGDKLIFSKYVNATTVSTYSLAIDNLTVSPVLLSTDIQDIVNIMELDF